MKRLQFSALLLVAVFSAGCGLLPFGSGGKLQVKESAAWTRVELAPDKAVDAPGLYLREMSSGKTEGWQVAAAAGPLKAVTFPADDLMVAHAEKSWYIINRQTGKVHEWDYASVALVAASSERVLLQELATGRLHVAGADMKVQRSLKPPEGVTTVVGAMASDGKAAAVVPSAGGPLYLIDLGSGKMTQVAGAPQGGAGPVVRSVKDGKEFVVGYEPSPGESASVLHRYAWDGTKLGELAVPGWTVYLPGTVSRWPAPVGRGPGRCRSRMWRPACRSIGSWAPWAAPGRQMGHSWWSGWMPSRSIAW